MRRAHWKAATSGRRPAGSRRLFAKTIQLRPGAAEGAQMGGFKEFLLLVAIMAAWFVLIRWVLPRFGVST
jgi:hypothetical protein